MVNALIQINEQTNRILNIVKAEHGLKDKGKAIEFVVSRYADEEEMRLVQKGIEKEMQDIRSGKLKTISYEKLKKKFKW